MVTGGAGRTRGARRGVLAYEYIVQVYWRLACARLLLLYCTTKLYKGFGITFATQ